ncbi:hypothetical protein [uncultured Pseudacidovorax sp.]|uniref:hypothetical protein n=1 Tax=uncultured Pseudacidovorax sp. TaxID=679313 RepID=UPI0025E77325|nr:hypothetical protein [uncultured Pseudacidovorax sp.]
MTDGRRDAGLGDVREMNLHAVLGAASSAWTSDEDASMNDADGGESVALAAYLWLGRRNATGRTLRRRVRGFDLSQ